MLNGEAGVVERVRRFSRAWLPVPVVGELRYGALNSRRPRENTAAVEALVSSCGILEMKDETAKVYARLRLLLKQKGHPIPENDVWIAALCIEHAIPLDTDDRHFLPLEDLRLVAR